MRLATLLLLVTVTACGSSASSAVLSETDALRVDSVLSHTVPGATDPFGQPIDAIDRREILRLLRDAQFDSLEAILDERWVATQRDIAHEGRLAHVYDSFVQGIGTIEPQLTRWMTERPNSGPARVAMASYRYGRALDTRGGRVAAATSDDRLDQSRDQATIGLRAATEALRLSPDHLTAYIMVLELAKQGGTSDPDFMRASLQAAMTAHPTSFLLRQAILGMLEPRWGGSIELMKQFAATAEEHVPQNPKLRAIAGAVPRAESFVQRRDFGMALALLDQAAFHGETYLLALAYGDLYQSHGRRVDALAAYQRALTHSPQGRSALDDRAALLVEIGALIEDRALREKVWAEAERSLKLLRELRPPYADPSRWLATLAEARAFCESAPAPCATLQ